jgi:glutamine---fructose-6-phosphate transaminase (isomerizing)
VRAFHALEDVSMVSTPNPGTHTIAEILSEPQTWLSCFAALDASGQLSDLSGKLQHGVEWIFVGCGSSFYLAQSAAATWSLLTGGPARAIPASEILLFPGVVPAAGQFVLISRSGHTSEVIQAAEHLKKSTSAPVLAITCGADTPLERRTAFTIVLRPADEKSTVMTRSFTSMLLALQALAAHRASTKSFLSALRTLPSETETFLASAQQTIRTLVNSHTFADYVFLGQGPFFGIAQESMLKVKEMSCSYGQCFHTLEFRHGPKAIVSGETLLTFVLSESGSEAELAVLEEMKELGGIILAVANKATAALVKSADYVIELGLTVPEVARAAAAVIPGQLLGFYTGIRKGFDPDSPRNLSRVVMLEGK